MLTAHNEADPLMTRLAYLLLPELAFEDAGFEYVIESLRQIANRALAASTIFALPGGISITTFLPPGHRLPGITLRIEAGMTLWDALDAAAAQAEPTIVIASVGLLICPLDIACFIRDYCTPPFASPPLCADSGPIDRPTQMALIGKYPSLACQSSPVRQAWNKAWIASDRSRAAAIALAEEIAGAAAQDDGCSCVAEIPWSLPAV